MGVRSPSMKPVRAKIVAAAVAAVDAPTAAAAVAAVVAAVDAVISAVVVAAATVVVEGAAAVVVVVAADAATERPGSPAFRKLRNAPARAGAFSFFPPARKEQGRPRPVPHGLGARAPLLLGVPARFRPFDRRIRITSPGRNRAR